MKMKRKVNAKILYKNIFKDFKTRQLVIVVRFLISELQKELEVHFNYNSDLYKKLVIDSTIEADYIEKDNAQSIFISSIKQYGLETCPFCGKELIDCETDKRCCFNPYCIDSDSFLIRDMFECLNIELTQKDYHTMFSYLNTSKNNSNLLHIWDILIEAKLKRISSKLGQAIKRMTTRDILTLMCSQTLAKDYPNDIVNTYKEFVTSIWEHELKNPLYKKALEEHLSDNNYGKFVKRIFEIKELFI